MIGGDDQEVVGTQDAQQFGQAAVECFEGCGIAGNVAAMAVMAVPVVGVLSSAWILAEPIGAPELAALILVVAGLFLLVRRPGR